jgi:hypothetical protein
MKRISFLALSLAITLSSCGYIDKKYGRSDDADTNLSFNLAGSGHFNALSGELYGGIYVYLVGQNGAPTANVLMKNVFTLSGITLPNGLYKLYAVGWDGDNSGACTAATPCSPVQNQTHCSDPAGVNVNLTGGSQVVSIALNQSNCTYGSASVFSGGQSSPAITSIKPLAIMLCGSASSLPTCNTPGSPWDVKFEIVTYRKDGNSMVINEAETDQIGCATSVSNSSVATGKNFVTGSTSAADRPFAYRFRIYPSSSGCTGTMQAEFLFKEGLENYATSPGSTNSYFDYNNSASSHAQLKLKGTF